jgi:ABC-type amino acid transport substrate-binding protein
MWPALSMGKAVTFTQPLFFAGIYPVVRADDKRFTDKMTLTDLNKPEFTISAQEGNATYDLVRDTFPNAKLFGIAPEADTTIYYQTVGSKKADVTVADSNGVGQYNKNNPETALRLLPTDPVKLQPFPMAVLTGQADLVNFLNLAIDEMHYNGTIDRILRKWEAEPGKTYLRVAKPYKE